MKQRVFGGCPAWLQRGSPRGPRFWGRSARRFRGRVLRPVFGAVLGAVFEPISEPVPGAVSEPVLSGPCCRVPTGEPGPVGALRAGSCPRGDAAAVALSWGRTAAACFTARGRRSSRVFVDEPRRVLYSARPAWGARAAARLRGRCSPWAAGLRLALSAPGRLSRPHRPQAAGRWPYSARKFCAWALRRRAGARAANCPVSRPERARHILTGNARHCHGCPFQAIGVPM
jgi:hypothetical protein